jgi:uncharacterized protein YbjT (DUF2867 family)
MNGRILVTGATGTVGREVVTRLAGAGATVRAAARNPGMLALPEDSVEILSMDLRDPADLDRAVADVEKIFLLTPLDQTMTEVTALVVDRARAHGVEHIVRLSALGVGYPRRITLGTVHGEAERIIRASGIDWTFLRPNAFMQNFISYWGESIRTRKAFCVPQGQGRVSLIDVRDIAEVAVETLVGADHRGKAYALTGPAALSNYEVAEIFSTNLGREISYQDISKQEARDALSAQGMSEWMVNVITELFEMSAADEAADVTDAVERLTGKTAIDFEAFVRDFRHAFT